MALMQQCRTVQTAHGFDWAGYSPSPKGRLFKHRESALGPKDE
jgi:hypothetical protein